jgi:hypothetical protein
MTKSIGWETENILGYFEGKPNRKKGIYSFWWK